MRVDRTALGIYLNDHLAGATGGVELARRAARSGTRHRAALAELAAEIAEDRRALKRIMRSLAIPRHRFKRVGAWLGEKAGRLKLNGRVFRRSPVSDVLELEALRIAVEGKAAGWRSLRRLAEDDDRLDSDLLDDLLAQAAHQIETLEGLRISAALDVFGARNGS